MVTSLHESCDGIGNCLRLSYGAEAVDGVMTSPAELGSDAVGRTGTSGGYQLHGAGEGAGSLEHCPALLPSTVAQAIMTETGAEMITQQTDRTAAQKRTAVCRHLVHCR
ncbi:hypothetical protein [Nocardia transvalensis]|uniref:hypothetical protein n=1 Tax=Nocardia transvalensis TaxID=37333 RepID=UPI00189557A1|nr:hypothetical protein [Nocardia transvalensis]MBF6330641.1 hypothetical protein [Nocardia transvalensis]